MQRRWIIIKGAERVHPDEEDERMRDERERDQVSKRKREIVTQRLTDKRGTMSPVSGVRIWGLIC